jgi:hypothetical protein
MVNKMKEDYLYFIRVGDKVRVGSAPNPTRKVKALQIANGEAVELLFFTRDFTETDMTARFPTAWVKEGWYRFTPEIHAFIEEQKLASGYTGVIERRSGTFGFYIPLSHAYFLWGPDRQKTVRDQVRKWLDAGCPGEIGAGPTLDKAKIKRILDKMWDRLATADQRELEAEGIEVAEMLK